MSQCPQCRRRIKLEATECLCGWGAKPITHSGSLKPLGVPGSRCVFRGCESYALVKVRDGSAYADICFDHIEPFYRHRVQNECGAPPPAAESIARIRHLMKNPKKRTRLDWVRHWENLRDNSPNPVARSAAVDALKKFGVADREPGSDDELDALAEKLADRMAA